MVKSHGVNLPGTPCIRKTDRKILKTIIVDIDHNNIRSRGSDANKILPFDRYIDYNNKLHSPSTNWRERQTDWKIRFFHFRVWHIPWAPEDIREILFSIKSDLNNFILRCSNIHGCTRKTSFRKNNRHILTSEWNRPEFNNALKMCSN